MRGRHHASSSPSESPQTHKQCGSSMLLSSSTVGNLIVADNLLTASAIVACLSMAGIYCGAEMIDEFTDKKYSFFVNDEENFHINNIAKMFLNWFYNHK